ncbi:cytosine deaminase protein-like protein [Phaeosphaeriaceae sp. PMI808]|nr:cytosine deaminase protein-like protein [Phaeosphaeriaceae sp. PMI808]
MDQDRDDDQGTTTELRKIAPVRIPGKPPSELWDINIEDKRISSIVTHNSSLNMHSLHVLDGSNRLIAPSLCHAHIHIDKCFLLQNPKFSDLQIESGDFEEAMDITAKAKSRFDKDDLLRRGGQLIKESIEHGVTAGLKLKLEYKDRCDIQICAFAQLPLFSGSDQGAKTRSLMAVAAADENVEVLGSTPYVEENEGKSRENARWIASLALAQGKHLDLHLDYFLEADKQPFIWDVLILLREVGWPQSGSKQVTLGHCTRLTRFEKKDWLHLKQEIGDLPVSFVGLPTSDLFMMRTPENMRGTLPVVEMIKQYSLNGAISVNNVGNAFTPQGNCDPLSVAQLAVGLYHAGTKQDAELLYETVSSRAKAVIGREPTYLNLALGQLADFVLFDKLESGWRCRKNISQVVRDSGSVRQTIYHGRLTTSRASL